MGSARSVCRLDLAGELDPVQQGLNLAHGVYKQPGSVLAVGDREQ